MPLSQNPHTMNIKEKIVNILINRMSQADREALVEHAIDHFFQSMTPEERQRMLEKLFLKLLEHVDARDLLSHVMNVVWNKAGTRAEQSGLMETMSKMANVTGKKLSGTLPDRLKKSRKD
jgi:acyl-CoA reductase-like NAD-dependent aldehyde dehydrogenase